MDIHFYFNYYLARYLCLDKPTPYVSNGQNVTEAYVIAWMAQRVDEDFYTEPINPGGQYGRGILSYDAAVGRQRFHFPERGNDSVIENDPVVRAAIQRQADAGDYQAFGVYLHIYQDTFAHQGYGDYWGHANASHGGHFPDIPYLNRERDRRMAISVWNRMLSLAKQRNPCCDLSKKSFDEFWKEIEPALYFESDDEAARIAEWQRIITNRFGEVTYYPSPAQSTDPWVRDFRATARNVPLWENPTAPPPRLAR